MSVNVRIDSMFKWASSIFDEEQEEYVWDIADLPEAKVRDDDQYYIFRKGDDIPIIAHKMLGSSRYWWVILHYNDLADALDTDGIVGQELRMPSRATLQKVFVDAFRSATDN